MSSTQDYPYLLRGLAVERADQIWCIDITYIPMAHGFVYLAAVVDWFSEPAPNWAWIAGHEIGVGLMTAPSEHAKQSKAWEKEECVEALEPFPTTSSPRDSWNLIDQRKLALASP